jgi:hypothetical protein
VTACWDGRKLEMTPESTAISRVEYLPNSEAKRFVVFFTRNPSKGYEFKDLEPGTWEARIEAQSKGLYYNSVIRSNPKYMTR